MYHLRIIQAATRDLERLDKPLARRIAERINWLAANLDDLRPEPFTATLRDSTNSASAIIALCTRFFMPRTSL